MLISKSRFTPCPMPMRTKVVPVCALPAGTYSVPPIIENVRQATGIERLDGLEEALVPAPALTFDDSKEEYKMFVQQQKMRYYSELASIVMQVTFVIIMITMVVASVRSGIGGRGNGISNFVSGRALKKTGEEVGVTFAQVAGLDRAKEELQEVVGFLKFPEKYDAIGATIPKGCLLSGGPGLGKTLLAKAVAGEAGVPFYSCSAAEFIELFVGVGASRIRDMFKQAKENAPCIIFIDEIDAIGRARGASNSIGNNDEREQTINQLLTEMDGFDSKKGVVVIAATNRPDILDPALVRPGRFDRQISLELPGIKAREEILRVHSKGKPLKECVSFEGVSRLTAGFSGAELMNLMNESAILAARRGETSIGMPEIEAALDRIILGLEKKDVMISREKRELTAYHEAGHALVALKIGEYDNIKKVSIIPRGNAGGVTIFDQDSERIESGMYSKRYLENQLAVALGGRVAEELVVGPMEMTTGASSDLERVQQIARAMVMQFGFSERLGPVGWAGGNRFENNYSERTLYEVDCEVRKLANTSYAKAKNLITNNKELLRKIAELLLEKETITGAEIKELDMRTKNLIQY